MISLEAQNDDPFPLQFDNNLAEFSEAKSNTLSACQSEESANKSMFGIINLWHYTIFVFNLQSTV
jgi:hypothetical protein